jgi:phage N-6-adenine-methyltransferase
MSFGGIIRERSDEWRTPPNWSAMGREVVGEFDLDPASSPLANEAVKAKNIYTLSDNALNREWWGRIWLNPPYSLLNQFTAKLLKEIEAGRVTEAIVLTYNATESKWFQNLAVKADAICFPRGRIHFIDQYGNPGDSNSDGQAFFYFGKNVAKFVEVFAPEGWIAISYITQI